MYSVAVAADAGAEENNAIAVAAKIETYLVILSIISS